ncbi:ANTAR domain-containing response regulator [Benzoatithermus flavus]|uniref:ANTAR domain-containing protein n=1 Tax=Benzoatithermus flavus TaxID=3108223 RepID=A0ABU8XXV2_9PROT
MSRRLVQNFRGMRALVALGPDRNRAVLLDTLGKLGLEAVPVEAPLGGETADGAGLVLFDADAGEGELLPWLPGTAPVPLVAVIGLETPSRLQRAFDHLPCAVLHKPVRANGVYTALFFAINEHRRRQELAASLRALEARHGARRFVIKAVLRLMERHGIDDEQAYRRLRKESMRQRLTVEELAVRVLAAGPPGSSAAAREA